MVDQQDVHEPISTLNTWRPGLRAIYNLPLQVFVEAADLDELNQARQESQAEMDENLANTNKTLETMREEVCSPWHSITLLAIFRQPGPAYKEIVRSRVI